MGRNKRDQLNSVFRKQIHDLGDYSVDKRIDVYRRLLPFCKKSDVEKQEHIDRILQMKTPTIPSPKPPLAVQAPEPVPRTDLCPRCGKQLVPRKGKNGPFIGCSGYPNCRFTKN